MGAVAVHVVPPAKGFSGRGTRHTRVEACQAGRPVTQKVAVVMLGLGVQLGKLGRVWRDRHPRFEEAAATRLPGGWEVRRTLCVQGWSAQGCATWEGCGPACRVWSRMSGVVRSQVGTRFTFREALAVPQREVAGFF